ncbi:MAG: sugar phosphorylase [Deltaproteobacteria bacterium]|nr:sugar phosphorylase [Deltaproteobacteria bacterium]
MKEGARKVKRLLIRIYGDKKGARAFDRIMPLVRAFPRRPRKAGGYFSQKDVVLITYGDTLKRPGEAPLKTLHDFLKTRLKEVVAGIHFLPFFPFSSDDGFAVIDFFSIDPRLGTWDDVAAIGRDFRLMFDYVVNHFSSKSRWFEQYLAGEKGFEEFAIEVDPASDLSTVTRPRSLPLLSAYRKKNGDRVHLWTTFSKDQIDFNFKSLDVLEKMVDVLLFYVAKGASILRLDAIAYLWKEIGTPSIHLPQTHAVVKLFRCILDMTAPDVVLLTETNVPHEENIRYFGKCGDEAQMVYNFTLPPLLLHAFSVGDVSRLAAWAQTLYLEEGNTTFFNFTASHDGIGVRPLEGILTQDEIDRLVALVKAHGGLVSHKQNPDGTESPYELNITYVDAILAGERRLAAQKFLASQAIQYVLPGVPATYIHSLLGSRNWLEGVRKTGMPRTINREKLDMREIAAELSDTDALRAKIFSGYVRLIRTRRGQPAFHPKAAFEVIDAGPHVFAIKRFCREQEIVALTNITRRTLHIPLRQISVQRSSVDLLTGKKHTDGELRLSPYQYVWLTNA